MHALSKEVEGTKESQWPLTNLIASIQYPYLVLHNCEGKRNKVPQWSLNRPSVESFHIR